MNGLKTTFFVGISIFMLISCKKEETPTPVQTLLDSGSTPKEVLDTGIPIDSLYGKAYQGGLIFYFDQNSEYGLVVADSDLNEVWANWGCFGTLISGADGTEIGTGSQNTMEIVAECTSTTTPAYLCANFSLNGYSDWFLPSKDELNAIYVNLKVNGLGNISDEQYWSSSEYDSNNVWRQYLGIGVENQTDGFQYYSTKDLLAVQSNIRPVRSF